MKKKIIIIPLIIIFLLLCAGVIGAYAFIGKKIPFLNKVITMPILEKDEKTVLTEMQKAMENANSFEHKADLNLNIKAEIDMEMSRRLNESKLVSFFIDKPIVLGIDNEMELDLTQAESVDMSLGASDPRDMPMAAMNLPSFDPGLMDVTYKLNSEGKTDKSDKENIKNESTIKLNFDMGGMEIKLEADVVVLGDKTYFKLGEIPFPLSLFLGMYMNKWFVIDTKEAEKFSQELEAEGGGNFPYNNSFNKEKIEKLEKELNELIKKHELIYVKERLPDEKIADSECYNYLLDIKEDNLTAFAQDLINLINKELNDVNPQILYGFDKEPKFQEAVEKIINAMEKNELQIWIDKENFYARQIKYDIGFDLSDIDIPDVPFPYKTFELNVYGNMLYDSFGADFDIQAPDGAEDLIKKIKDQLMEARAKARDAKRLSDVKQIQTALELYYNDEGKYPDSMNVGEPIKSGETIIMSAVPSYPKPSDGDCEEDFEYYYQMYNNGQSYELTYCLGMDTGYVKAGVNVASPSEVTGSDRGLENFMGGDDIDGDGLTNDEEQKYGTKIDAKDSDDDGLYDYEEIFIYETDPLNRDSDGDTYTDGDEVKGWYNPMGEGTIAKDYSSPERTIRLLDTELLNNNNVALYNDKYYKSESFREFIREEMDMSLEELDQAFADTIFDYLPDEKLEFQNFIKIEKIDDTHVSLDYENHYETANDYVTIKDKDKSYFVLINGEWLLDIEAEFKETKAEDPLEWEMMKRMFTTP